MYTLETAREVQGCVLPGRSHSCDRLSALFASKGLAQGRNSCWQVTRLFPWWIRLTSLGRVVVPAVRIPWLIGRSVPGHAQERPLRRSTTHARGFSDARIGTRMRGFPVLCSGPFDALYFLV